MDSTTINTQYTPARAPSPWKIGSDHFVRDATGHFVVVLGLHHTVAGGDFIPAKLNTSFIVRAVNSHEQLVAALKETLATVNGWLDDARGYPPEDILASDGAWHKRALEALAAAGEQP